MSQNQSVQMQAALFLGDLDNDEELRSPSARNNLHGLQLPEHISFDSHCIRGHDAETQRAWTAMSQNHLPDTPEVFLLGEMPVETSSHTEAAFAWLGKAECNLLRQAISTFLCHHLTTKLYSKSYVIGQTSLVRMPIKCL